MGKTTLANSKREFIEKWPDHDNPTKDSDPARYLEKHINHVFTWN